MVASKPERFRRPYVRSFLSTSLEGPAQHLYEDVYCQRGPAIWLFPGGDPMLPMSTRQFNRAVHAAAAMAEIKKRVTPHTLRHYAESRIMPSDFRFLLADSGKLESNSA
jgi:integrase